MEEYPLPKEIISLRNICYKELCRILPKECLEELRSQDIELRSVWVLANKVFNSRESALAWKEEYNSDGGGYYTDAEPFRILLDEIPGDRLYIWISDSGMFEGNNDMWSPLCVITPSKKVFKTSNAHQYGGFRAKKCKHHLVNGQWVL